MNTAPTLATITDELAGQAYRLEEIERLIIELLVKVDKMTSNQDEELALAQQIEALVSQIEASQQTALTEIAALQAAAANGQPVDFTALTQAVTDLGTAATGAASVATAAATPPPPPPPSS